MNLTSFAWKNLTRRLVRTMLTAGGVGLAVAVAVSLGGFNLGYRQAIAGSIEQLGFQVMVMAKGCPYEAATMMLKGGSGLLYLPEEAHEQIRTDPDIGRQLQRYRQCGQRCLAVRALCLRNAG